MCDESFSKWSHATPSTTYPLTTLLDVLSLAGTETEEEAEAAAEAQVREAVFSQVHIPRHLDQMPMKQVRGKSVSRYAVSTLLSDANDAILDGPLTLASALTLTLTLTRRSRTWPQRGEGRS